MYEKKSLFVIIFYYKEGFFFNGQYYLATGSGKLENHFWANIFFVIKWRRKRRFFNVSPNSFIESLDCSVLHLNGVLSASDHSCLSNINPFKKFIFASHTKRHLKFFYHFPQFKKFLSLSSSAFFPLFLNDGG